MMNLCCVLMFGFFFFTWNHSVYKVLSVFDTGLVVGGVHVHESHFGIKSVGIDGM